MTGMGRAALTGRPSDHCRAGPAASSMAIASYLTVSGPRVEAISAASAARFMASLIAKAPLSRTADRDRKLGGAGCWPCSVDVIGNVGRAREVTLSARHLTPRLAGSAHRRSDQRRPDGPNRTARGPAFADHGGDVRLGAGTLRRRSGPTRARRRRIASRRELMAHVRRELDGGRLAVHLAGRGHDHHHEGDCQHQHPGGSGQARRLGALPAYHGRHLNYPVSPVNPCSPYLYGRDRAAINTTVRAPGSHRGFSPGR